MSQQVYNNAIFGVDFDLDYTGSFGRQVADLKSVNGDIALRGSTEITALSPNYNNLRQAIAIRLGTPQGTLLAHLGYGSLLYRLIGKPRQTHIVEFLTRLVAEALLQEPRIGSVDAINVEFPDDDRARVDVSFTLTPAGESTPINWVYPFYLEEAQE